MPVRMRVFIFGALIAALMIGLVPQFSALALDAGHPSRQGIGQQLARPIVIVNTSYQNVRSGPGAIYSVIGIVPGGTELPVMGRNRDASWWQVESVFGVGWVSAEFVIPRGDFRAVPVVAAPGIIEQARAAVTGEPVNVYVFPDTGASLLGLALGGSELPIMGQTSDGLWWQVETNVGSGWVMQSDVALRGNGATVPVVTAQAVFQPGGVPVVAGSSGSTAPPGGFAGSSRPVAYVYAERVQIKDRPDPEGEHMEFLERDDRVEVLDFSEDGEWALIQFMGNRMGWVRVADVAISDPFDSRTQVFFDGPGVLDLKATPSMDSIAVAMVPAFERLVVADAADGGSWLLLEHDMGRGWAPAEAVEIIRVGPPRSAAPAATGAQLSGSVIQPSGAAVVASQPQPSPARAYVIVNTSFLHIRSGPGAGYTVLSTASGGTELDITGSTPDAAWFRVQGAYGTGWVNSEFVIFRGNFDAVPIIRYADAVGMLTTPEAIVSAPVNVYLGPGVETGLLGTAPAGLIMPVIGRTGDGGWLQVQTDSGPGWVLSSTVTFRGDMAQVPIVG